MSRVTINDGVTYLKAQLATLTTPKLDMIEYTDYDTKTPRVKNYGAHIYISSEDPDETERKYIGPLLNETYTLNLDVIIAKHYRRGKSISDTYGISFWVDAIKNLLQGGKNSGAFQDSSWKLSEVDSSEDSYKIKGLFIFEVINQY